MRRGQVVAMIHSGSRNVGGVVGKRWVEKAREAWPAGARYPDSGVFPLSWTSNPKLCREYLEAEATAAHYGAVNRAILGELLRRRLREVYGDLEAPLIYDLPHNVTLREGSGWVSRKGACPAGAGRAVARIDMGRVRDLGLGGVECVTLRDERRIEEAPAAYKPIGPVIDAQVQAGIVDVVARFRPLLTFKA